MNLFDLISIQILVSGPDLTIYPEPRMLYNG